VLHGFNIPDLGLRADLEPGETVRVRLVPEKAGTFEFHCDNFCGIDHEDMSAHDHRSVRQRPTGPEKLIKVTAK
jgi:heme/copper-type cytochrome/quinol oxidase subunit 2